jgi:hypothetical protein
MATLPQLASICFWGGRGFASGEGQKCTNRAQAPAAMAVITAKLAGLLQKSPNAAEHGAPVLKTPSLLSFFSRAQ